MFALPSNCSIHVKWSGERTAGITDDDELVFGVLLFACARACGTKSSADTATSNEPHNLVAFLPDWASVLIRLGTTGSLVFVYFAVDIVDMTFDCHDQRQPPWA